SRSPRSVAGSGSLQAVVASATSAMPAQNRIADLVMVRTRPHAFEQRQIGAYLGVSRLLCAARLPLRGRFLHAVLSIESQTQVETRGNEVRVAFEHPP